MALFNSYVSLPEGVYTWKTMTTFSVRTGLDIFFVRHVFSKYGHVRLQTLYLQVNRFPELLDLSDWLRQYECLV